MKEKIFLITVFLAFASCDENIEKAFKDNEVVPDVISAIPDALLEVKYTKSGKQVNLGNELAPKDVKDIPEVTYEAESDSFYTLILTDPDAPSRKNPVRREWNHWLVVNIPGSRINEGEVVNEYVGSGSPPDGELRRYIFLLFKQPKKQPFHEHYHSNRDADRDLFNTENFAKKYNLGKPVAGNFFVAQYDDYVPELYKQLGFAPR